MSKLSPKFCWASSIWGRDSNGTGQRVLRTKDRSNNKQQMDTCDYPTRASESNKSTTGDDGSLRTRAETERSRVGDAERLRRREEGSTCRLRADGEEKGRGRGRGRMESDATGITEKC
ncbi:hypothetical protein BV20DRAFT_188553 [Pilatotrama ljubarskyi]|nr:hypothetical protein BV20DRAFT_188553 [Pilatotrama ljubarskyi]